MKIILTLKAGEFLPLLLVLLLAVGKHLLATAFKLSISHFSAQMPRNAHTHTHTHAHAQHSCGEKPKLSEAHQHSKLSEFHV